MNGRRLVGLALALASGLAVLLLWPKEKLSPEDEIRQLVARAVQAAEKRQPSGVIEVLDERFRGPGGAGREDVRQLLVGQFFRAQQVVVMNPLLEVSVRSPTEGHFKGTFVFARDGAALDASRYEIEADLVRAEDGWRVVSASWSR
ncbi:MAG: hypothetical protein ACOZQL_35230 [Myxococcota bacterium]